MTDNGTLGVVTVGASAGGVEALTQLASNLPCDLPYAYLVVLHMPPNAPSVLTRIVDRAGPLAAFTAVHGSRAAGGNYSRSGALPPPAGGRPACRAVGGAYRARHIGARRSAPRKRPQRRVGVVGNARSPLGVSIGTVHATPVLAIDGVLDSTTYLTVRDRIIKAALEEPPAVIVDVTALKVPAASAWSVFTSARWHVSRWPDIPIALVCAHEAGRNAITRNGVDRYVPVYTTTEAALTGVVHGARRGRRRAHAQLPATLASLPNHGGWFGRCYPAGHSPRSFQPSR